MQQLSSASLDEMSVALFAGATVAAPPTVAEELNPFLEWYWMKAAGHSLGEIKGLGPLLPMQRSLQAGNAWWLGSPDKTAGYFHVRRDARDVENAAWIGFLLAFSKAVSVSGLSNRLGHQLTGAVKEMEDNVHLHSGRPRSGLVAFLSQKDSFEFTVLDRGVGVLATLREAIEFSHVADDGHALELATHTGNSRFGAGSNHGWGFDDLTVGIANSNARIRFRSGDGLLLLDGTREGQIVPLRLQRARSSGFLISVRVERR